MPQATQLKIDTATSDAELAVALSVDSFKELLMKGKGEPGCRLSWSQGLETGT